MSTEPPLPIRQATRILNEFGLLATTAGLVAVGPNLDRATVFLAVLRATLRNPDDPAISANALASSLQRPLETIRRHMQTLVQRGLCRLDGRRFLPANDFTSSAEVDSVATHILPLFRNMLQAFRLARFDVPAEAATKGDSQTLIVALDIYLGSYELSEAPMGNSMNLYVMGAVAVLNAAAITHDPILSQRYAFAETVPPDSLRCPATAQAIAAVAGLPYATIWRHATALAQAGALDVTPQGYLLAKQWMDDPGTSERSRARVLHFNRAVRRLAALV